MRNALLWASTNPFLAERLPRYGFVQKATRRFMPGERLEDALGEARRLSGKGFATTLTLLGENLGSEVEAEAVLEHYLEVLQAIHAEGLDAEISIKPTQLGLDYGAEGTLDRLSRLVSATDSRVWIDMESSPYVDRTIHLFRAAKERHENVGIAMQAYLHRARKDIEDLLPLDPSIRLVKGAYNEPAAVAFDRKAAVDQNYVGLTSLVLRARASGGRGTAVIATHDPRMIGEAGRMAHELGLAKGSFEYSMLYGIQVAQQTRLAAAGHRVRVLVSYGSAWFPWYMRRLAERPANVWFVLKQIAAG